MSLSSELKWFYTLKTTAIFLAVSNPYTYKLVQSLVGNRVAISRPDGCPTTEGFIIHTIVFTLLLRLAMEK